MNPILFIILSFCLMHSTNTFGQDEFLYSSDGRTISRQRQLIQSCLMSLNKKKSDPTARAICECQVNLINGHFTFKQFKKHTTNGIINFEDLIKEDSALDKAIEKCYTQTGKIALLSAESNGTKFITGCMSSIQANTNKKLDTVKLKSFCTCQLNLIKTKRLSDAQLEALKNPNSLIFYEMLYKCGNPFSERDDKSNEWNENSKNFIRGPETDTVDILPFNGMTYVKLKIGSSVQFWLFDSGASDLLITKELESILKNENIINDSNYLGIREYEMANGSIDTCKSYKINEVKIGHFSVDNITIAVSEKGKKLIAGKALFNKFRYWFLNNQRSELILTK